MAGTSRTFGVGAGPGYRALQGSSESFPLRPVSSRLASSRLVSSPPGIRLPRSISQPTFTFTVAAPAAPLLLPLRLRE